MTMDMLGCCRWMHQVLGWQPRPWERGYPPAAEDSRHCQACGRWWFWMDGAWWKGTVELEADGPS